MMSGEALPADDAPAKPAIVFPYHDPQGVMFTHLAAITPVLKNLFSQAYLSISSLTDSKNPDGVKRLKDDPFFSLIFPPEAMPVGKYFHALYEHAATSSQDATILHLCFIDRLAFALETDHRDRFIKDMKAVDRTSTPLIFQRSASAWTTHPRNYYEIEHFATTVGELLLGKALDFAWCHLAIQAGQLKSILPSVRSQDMSMMAEIVLLCQEQMDTLDVDWLAWEDPFILACDPAVLKHEREGSTQETQKRLSYVLSMVDRIIEYRSKI